MQCLQLTRGDAPDAPDPGVTVELSGDFSYGSVTVDGTKYTSAKTLKLKKGTSVNVTVEYTGDGILYATITLNGTLVGTTTDTGSGGSNCYYFGVTDNCTIVFNRGTSGRRIVYGTATITMPA